MNPLPDWGENDFPQKSKTNSTEYTPEEHEVVKAIDEIAEVINSLLIKSLNIDEQTAIKGIINNLETAKVKAKLEKKISKISKGKPIFYDKTGPIPFPKEKLYSSETFNTKGQFYGGIDLDDEIF